MSDISSFDDLVYRIFRTRQTSYKMLRKRGYLVLDEDIDLTLDDFKARYVSNNNILFDQLIIKTEHMVSHDKIVVRYIHRSEKKISGKDVTDVIENTYGNNPDMKRLILILVGEFTPIAKTALTVTNAPYIVETFTASELVVDITEHELVPEHTVLTEEEKTALLNQYGLKPTQLPCLMKHDPIARYFGLQKDDVVRITRRSETAGKYVTYRIVNV